MKNQSRLRKLAVWIVVTIFAVGIMKPLARAENAHVYPIAGKIVGRSANQITRTVTYRVLTESKIYELDCGKHAVFSSTPPECGGEKKLQIGDEIHFRLEKNRAYLPVEPSVDPSGEQKLRILREEVKPSTP